MTTGGGALPKYGGGAAPTERMQKSTVEIALVGLRATEKLLLRLCNPPKREQGRHPRTAGGRETGKPTVAERHGTGAKPSAGAEIGIEAKKESESASESAAEKGSAAGGRRARGTGRRRGSDTEIKMQRKGEIGKETETEPEIPTGGIMTATEEETATVSGSGNARETEKRDATDPEARSGTGTETETAGKTGDEIEIEIETVTVTEIGTRTRTRTGTESGTGIEIEIGIGTGTGTGKKTRRGIVVMGAEAKKSERRKKTNIVPPRTVKNLQKMQKARPLRNEHYIMDFGDC